MSNIPPPSGSDPQRPQAGPPPGSGAQRPGGPAVEAGALSPMWKMTEGPPPGWQPKSKVAAGILGILLGSLGIHSFYLGNAKKGIIQLVVSVVTCGLGGIWGLIEGIQILTGSIATDAYGVQLTE